MQNERPKQTSLDIPLVTRLDFMSVSHISLHEADLTTNVELNQKGRLCLKKLLYEKMTPDEYKRKGLSDQEIAFLDYLGTII